jgi:hypothetical protein
LLIRLFREQRQAFTGLQQEELIEGIAGSGVAQLGTATKPQAQVEERYVREKKAGLA